MIAGTYGALKKPFECCCKIYFVAVGKFTLDELKHFVLVIWQKKSIE